ncbi:hypothetical protein TeGR_g517, partial [Tetraparma gracilis]
AAPPPPPPPASKPSRASAASSLNMDDATQRQSYYAAYHQRPAELDSSRSLPSSLTSAPSGHIFAASDASKQAGGFSDLPLHASLLSSLADTFSLSSPTLIQAEACRSLLGKGRRNLFVQSETGSGKTLAYLLPVLQSLAVSKD